jgi:heme/copper-type cytochrome/quinol oxidase subunit 3
MAVAALPPAPPAHRRNVVLIGSLLAIAAGTTLVGGLLGIYFAARDSAQAANQAWPPDGVDLPNVPLAVAYGTLLMSSFTAAWAAAALRIDDRRQAYLAVGLTIAFGLLFINALSFSWQQLGIVSGDGAFADAVWAVTGVHALLVVAVIVLFVVVGFRVLGGQFSPRNRELVLAAGAFWHFVVAAGAAVYWCLWFLMGGP